MIAGLVFRCVVLWLVGVEVRRGCLVGVKVLS